MPRTALALPVTLGISYSTQSVQQVELVVDGETKAVWCRP